MCAAYVGEKPSRFVHKNGIKNILNCEQFHVNLIFFYKKYEHKFRVMRKVLSRTFSPIQLQFSEALKSSLRIYAQKILSCLTC